MKNIQGVLTLNLDPAYLFFEPACEIKIETRICDCSDTDLCELLLALGFADHQLKNWPPKEFFVRWAGDFPSETLAKFGVLPLSSLPA